MADFPPSSRVAGISFSAAAFATLYPTSVEPVKASFLNPLCSSIYCPDLEPAPEIMLITPFGTISLISFINSNTLRGVAELVFKTVQHPEAKTGASFQAAIRKGKFQGTICPTTPMGSRMIKERVFSSKKLAESSSVRIAPAK